MMTILIPAGPHDREFAMDRILDDLARGRGCRADAAGMLAQLRLAGDLANLERLAHAIRRHDAP